MSSQEGMVAVWDTRSRDQLKTAVWVTERQDPGESAGYRPLQGAMQAVWGGMYSSDAPSQLSSIAQAVMLCLGWRQLVYENRTIVRRRPIRVPAERSASNDSSTRDQASGARSGSGLEPNESSSNDIQFAGNIDEIFENRRGYSQVLPPSPPSDNQPDEEFSNSENIPAPQIGAGRLSLWFESDAVQAPSWGVRCVKFMKMGNGKDALVFAEVLLYALLNVYEAYELYF